MLRELQLEPPVRAVVVNQIAPAAGMSVADAEHVLGVPVDVVDPVAQGRRVVDQPGVPVVETAPRDPASKAVRAMARRLHDILRRREFFRATRRPAPDRTTREMVR